MKWGRTERYDRVRDMNIGHRDIGWYAGYYRYRSGGGGAWRWF